MVWLDMFVSVYSFGLIHDSLRIGPARRRRRGNVQLPPEGGSATCAGNGLPPNVYGFSTTRQFRSLPKPLVNHSVGFTASPHFALLSSIT